MGKNERYVVRYENNMGKNKRRYKHVYKKYLTLPPFRIISKESEEKRVRRLRGGTRKEDEGGSQQKVTDHRRMPYGGISCQNSGMFRHNRLNLLCRRRLRQECGWLAWGFLL